MAGGNAHSGTARADPTVAVAAGTLLVATVTAELALVPISAVVFSRVTFAGLALNFAAIPLMAVVQAAAMVTLAAATIAPMVAAAAGYVTHVGASWLIRSAALSTSPWLRAMSRRHRGPWSPPITRALPVVSSADALVGPPSRDWRPAVDPSDWPGALHGQCRGPPAPGKLRVVFLDVGQGDATLVQIPDGRAMLVDAGGIAGSGSTSANGCLPLRSARSASERWIRSCSRMAIRITLEVHLRRCDGSGPACSGKVFRSRPTSS